MTRRARVESPAQRAMKKRRAAALYAARVAGAGARPASAAPASSAPAPAPAPSSAPLPSPAPAARSSRGALIAAIALSIVAHGGIAVLTGSGGGDADAPVEVELAVQDPSLSGAGTATDAPSGDRAHGEDPLRPGGRESAQNVDARECGERGDDTGPDAVRLVVRADEVRLQDSPMTATGVAQVQRIDTARDRASREDRRATPHPDRDVTVATGDGAHRERRPSSPRDPRDGAREAPVATERGEHAQGTGATSRSAPATMVLPGEGAPLSTGAADGRPTGAADTHAAGEAGRDAASPGTGIAAGTGAREAEAARVATARPVVDEGPAATLTDAREHRVRDDERADLLATVPRQSWVEASPHGGAHIGAGAGGTRGGGVPGTGGSHAEGGRARAFGPGDGDFDSLDTSDPRYQRWFLEQSARVDRHLVFPRERMLSMDQGIAVYRVTIARDGHVVGAPELLHSTGFDDLDRAALVALTRSMPFSPVPDAILAGHATLRLVMPIQFLNPMVH